MKKIIRLTESDLARIVKRVINENTDQQKYDKLYNAVSGLGTDEEAFVKTVESIRDKSEYDRINAIGKRRGEDIITLFNGDFGGGTDSSYFYRFCSKLNLLKVPIPQNCHMKLFGMTTRQTYVKKPEPMAPVR